MNGPVKKALGLSVKHNEQANKVFNMLRVDFMKPAIDKGIAFEQFVGKQEN